MLKELGLGLILSIVIVIAAFFLVFLITTLWEIHPILPIFLLAVASYYLGRDPWEKLDKEIEES